MMVMMIMIKRFVMGVEEGNWGFRVEIGTGLWMTFRD